MLDTCVSRGHCAPPSPRVAKPAAMATPNATRPAGRGSGRAARVGYHACLWQSSSIRGVVDIVDLPCVDLRGCRHRTPYVARTLAAPRPIHTISSGTIPVSSLGDEFAQVPTATTLRIAPTVTANETLAGYIVCLPKAYPTKTGTNKGATLTSSMPVHIGNATAPPATRTTHNSSK